MFTTCKQNLGVAPWRQKFSRLKDLFIMMFSMLWYSRGKKEFAESIWYLWGICCCNMLFVHTADLRIKTAFNLVKRHLLFRIMLLIQWSVIVSIFVVHVFIVFRRLKYIPRLFSEYMLTFMVEDPMRNCVTNYIRKGPTI